MAHAFVAVVGTGVPRGWVIVFAALASWGLFAILLAAALAFAGWLA